MDYATMPYQVYVKTDTDGRIIDINSNAFLLGTDGWTQIDEGYGDRFAHAQGNYLPQSIMDDRGIYRYKLVEGVVTERTTDEMDADYVPPEDNPGSGEGDSDLAEKVAALQKQVDEQAAQLAAYEAAYTEGVNEA